MNHHSKWPYVFRVHGSVTPELIMPLLLVGAWTTLIWAVDQAATDNMKDKKKPKPRMLNRWRYTLFNTDVDLTVHFDSILLTVLGFVVGLGLSLRSSTAYERWTEGRK